MPVHALTPSAGLPLFGVVVDENAVHGATDIGVGCPIDARARGFVVIAAGVLKITPMRMSAGRAPRFHVAGTISPGSEISLPEGAARHCSVLRLRQGDAVVIFNGNGGDFSAELTSLSQSGARIRILSQGHADRESPLRIVLAQCVASGDRMDVVLQKSTELGVYRIVPIASERSIVRLSRERAERRIAHWRNVVIAACEQCGRNRVPEITAITALEEFLVDPEADSTRLLLAPDAPMSLKQLPAPRSVTVLVGPEGGLSTIERRLVEESGFVPVRFGPRVLRTETAPLAAIAAMQTLWGDC
jgi:16S rRNA (uracil1498-N3)-methyltransferase